MKRIIGISILLIVVILCIISVTFSPNNSANTTMETDPSSIKDSQVTNKTITLEFAFGERTGVYTGIVNAQGLPNGKGIYRSCNTEDNTTWSYEGDWVNGHWNGKGISKWDNGSSYNGEYKNDYENGQGTYIFEDGKKIKGVFFEGQPMGEATLYYTDGTTLKGDFTSYEDATGTYYDNDGYEYDAKLINDELLKTSKYDFFDNKTRQKKYTNLYESYKYSELEKYVNKYIADDKPCPIDSAYSILKLIKPLKKYENNWIVTNDNFDNTKTLTFKNVTGISENRCVDISVRGTSNNTTLGFIKDDWLFFNRIKISADSKIIYDSTYKSYNIQRETLGGMKIEESVECSFYEDDANEIIKSNNVRIRFENDDKNEYYENNLTDDDVKAIYCSVYLQKNNRDLSNLLYEYIHKD